jgi:hypothetical protein
MEKGEESMETKKGSRTENDVDRYVDEIILRDGKINENMMTIEGGGKEISG